LSESAKRRLKKIEGQLPPPEPGPGEDDPQLTDCLPFGVRLRLIEAQERAEREGRAALVAGDLPPEVWGILGEWQTAKGKLNKALKAARKRADIPPATPHLSSVRDLPLSAEVRQMLERWDRVAGEVGPPLEYVGGV
jgi:hypothetical protein